MYTYTVVLFTGFPNVFTNNLMLFCKYHYKMCSDAKRKFVENFHYKCKEEIRERGERSEIFENFIQRSYFTY